MKLDTLITKLCYSTLWATTTMIFFILCTNTVFRFMGQNGMDWAAEVPELLFPWLVMSGVVLAAVHGSHITTSFLRDRLKPAHQRWLAISVWALVAGLYATLCVATYKMLDIVKDEKSPVLGVPGSVTYGCVLLGMFLLMVLAIKDAITAIKTPALEIATNNAAAEPNTHY